MPSRNDEVDDIPEEIPKELSDTEKAEATALLDECLRWTGILMKKLRIRSFMLLQDQGGNVVISRFNPTSDPRPESKTVYARVNSLTGALEKKSDDE